MQPTPVLRPQSTPAQLIAAIRLKCLTSMLAVWMCLASPGAPAAPAGELPVEADPAVYGIEVEDQHRQHWAFRPMVRPTVPPVRNWVTGNENVANPVDAFLQQALDQAGLQFNPQAPPALWLRRVTFDLIGLAPTLAETTEFLADPSPAARGRVVDRLLAHPGYGIRWGRRWMDVVRYADSNGYERDGAKPQAWRYRDWVVESLNADKPYDQFLREQLAGDELPDRTAESWIGTTLLRLGTWDDEPANPLVDRYDQLDDVVGTVSTAFLGLTLRCARCHNHKFEPLSQIDYARFLAIFEPLQRPQKGRTELDVPVGTRRELADHAAAVSRQAATTGAVQQQLSALLERVRERYFADGPQHLSREAFEAHRVEPSGRTPQQIQLVQQTLPDFQRDLAARFTRDEQRQRSQFEAALVALQQATPTPLPRAYVFQEQAAVRPITQVFRRGNPATPAGRVAAGVPAVLTSPGAPAELGPPRVVPPEGETGRRSALADWLTSPSHPLTARVIVNRLWQGHFGEGLVSTENDFGIMGAPPHASRTARLARDGADHRGLEPEGNPPANRVERGLRAVGRSPPRGSPNRPRQPPAVAVPVPPA